MKIKKLKETKPLVTHIDLRFVKELKSDERQRRDVYFEGTVRLIFAVGKPSGANNFNLKVHLMNDPKFDPDNSKKWFYSGELGDCKYDENKDDCPYCTGSHGTSDAHTKGLVAEAVGDALNDLAMLGNARLSQVYSLVQYDKPGGWFVFRHEVPRIVRKDLDAGVAPKFYHAEIEEYDCPMHGKFLWKHIESDF